MMVKVKMQTLITKLHQKYPNKTDTMRAIGMMTIMAGTIVGVHHRDILLHMGWGMGCPDLEVFFDLIVGQSPREVHIGEEDLQMALATFGSAHAYYFMLFQLL